MSGIAGGIRLQLALLWRAPAEFMALFIAPLFALVFVVIAAANGRSDLRGYAIVAPIGIAMLNMAITTSGSIVHLDRVEGVLEYILCSRSRLVSIVAGRVVVVSAISCFAAIESYLVVSLVLGSFIPIRHPFYFIVTVIGLGIGSIGTGLLLAGIVVRSRYAVTLQNSLSYPLYVLGGVLVPSASLPAPVNLASRFIYLSWGSDLLRSAIDGAGSTGVSRGLAFVATITATLLAGVVLIIRAERRAKLSEELISE